MSDLVTNVIETLPSTVRFIVEFFMFTIAAGDDVTSYAVRLDMDILFSILWLKLAFEILLF